jgi:hypothetical protein
MFERKRNARSQVASSLSLSRESDKVKSSQEQIAMPREREDERGKERRGEERRTNEKVLRHDRTQDGRRRRCWHFSCIGLFLRPPFFLSVRLSLSSDASGKSSAQLRIAEILSQVFAQSLSTRRPYRQEILCCF